MKITIVETKIINHVFDTDKWGDKFLGKNKEQCVKHLEQASIDIGFNDVAASAISSTVEDWHTNVDTQNGEVFNP